MRGVAWGEPTADGLRIQNSPFMQRMNSSLSKGDIYAGRADESNEERCEFLVGLMTGMVQQKAEDLRVDEDRCRKTGDRDCFFVMHPLSQAQ